MISNNQRNYFAYLTQHETKLVIITNN